MGGSEVRKRHDEAFGGRTGAGEKRFSRGRMESSASWETGDRETWMASDDDDQMTVGLGVRRTPVPDTVKTKQ